MISKADDKARKVKLVMNRHTLSDGADNDSDAVINIGFIDRREAVTKAVKHIEKAH